MFDSGLNLFAITSLQIILGVCVIVILVAYYMYRKKQV